MLAASVRQYIYRYAVAPGRRAMLAIQDAGERDLTRSALLQAGIAIAGELQAGEHLVKTRGHSRIRGVICRSHDGAQRHISCDLLCISAGWNPNAQLAAQTGTGLRFERKINALIPATQSGITFTTGACRGVGPLADCIHDGELQARRALADLQQQAPDSGPLP